MNRRSFLTGLAGGATLSAGCLSRGVDRPHLLSSRLDRVEPRRDRKSRPVVVAWDDAAGVVAVSGFVWYGSSSCDRPSVADATYDPDRDALRVVVEPGKKRQFLPVFGCTGDMAGADYRITARFAGGLPAAVTVVERNAADRTERRTVGRAAQERLCTSSHAPGSEAAARAHWTCPEKYLRAAASVDADD
jgi:hypothetical protein